MTKIIESTCKSRWESLLSFGKSFKDLDYLFIIYFMIEG